MSDKKPDEVNIDFSKIRNIEAASTVEPGLEEKLKEAGKKRKSGKFSFIEAETIPIPSGGKLYKDVTEDKDILGGFIKMYPMTIKEEEILSTPRFIKTGSATRMIIDRCLASEIEAKDLLLFDSNFILFYLRKISYGDEYSFELTCTNRVCEQKFNHKIDISKLDFEELSEDIKEPIVVKLPYSKYTVKVMLPRLYNSEEIFMRNRNRKKGTDDEDRRMIDNLLVTTIKVLDETRNQVPENDWEEFFEALPGMDSAELRDKTSFDTGVDEIKGVVCPYCDAEYTGTIPLGPEFFVFSERNRGVIYTNLFFLVRWGFSYSDLVYMPIDELHFYIKLFEKNKGLLTPGIVGEGSGGGQEPPAEPHPIGKNIPKTS